MSSVLPASAASGDPVRTARAVAWAREPLLHFLLLGALIFAVDLVFFAPEDTSRVVTIDAAVDAEARDAFGKARGREPNADELYALRRIWLDNEVLFREGIAMGLDKGDKTIRDRVVFKMLSVVESGLKPPALDEAVVRAWFEKNRARYDDPARFDFQEAVLVGGAGEDAARALAAGLNAGNPPAEIKAGLRVFKARPHGNIVESYGESFAKTLEASPPGEWRVITDKAGARVMRLESVKPPVRADFDAIANVVAQDWLDATMAEQRTAAVRDLARKYTVRTRAAQ